MQEIRQISSQLQRLKLKITSKLFSDNKWTGVLVGPKNAYFRCLEIDERMIDNIFEADHKFWLDNLQKTKDTIGKQQQELKSLLTH